MISIPRHRRPLSPEREQSGRKTKAISDPGWGGGHRLGEGKSAEGAKHRVEVNKSRNGGGVA